MIITPEEASAILVSAILAIVAGGAQSVVTEPVVNIIKWIVEKLNIPLKGNVILFAVAAVVTVLTWISGRLGMSVQLQSTFDWLATVAPPALTLLVTLFGSKMIYNASVNRNIPLAGYARTPEFTPSPDDTVIESTMKTYPASVADVMNPTGTLLEVNDFDAQSTEFVRRSIDTHG